MIEVSWLLFLIASVAVILTPGQDMILVMSRSITQGAVAGVVTAGGVSTGLLLHTLLATLGVGAVVQASELLFLIIKMVGAVYLLYLGFSLLRVSNSNFLEGDAAVRPLARLYWDGAFSNIANPKIAVFYFAFLPQFVLPDATNPTLCIFALGAGFALLTFIIKGPVGYFAALLSSWLQRKPAHLTAIYRLSGLVLVGLGVKLFFEKQVR